MASLLRLFLILILALLSNQTLAQRGESVDSSPAVFTSPTQGYPGFFDTNMAEPQTMVIEWPPIILPFIPVPSIAMDYGVNERLTLGTNALMTTIPWLLGVKSAAVKARTLLIGNESMQSTATGYLGYFGGGAGLTMYWQLFTSNNAWKVAPSHIVSANAAFINFGLEAGESKKTDYTSIQLSTVALSAGHQYLVGENSSISTYVMLPAWSSVNIDTVSAAFDINSNASRGDTMWAMARMSFDLHSEPWVYSIGGMYNYGSVKDLLPRTAGLLPWFSATRKY